MTEPKRQKKPKIKENHFFFKFIIKFFETQETFLLTLCADGEFGG